MRTTRKNAYNVAVSAEGAATLGPCLAYAEEMVAIGREILRMEKQFEVRPSVAVFRRMAQLAERVEALGELTTRAVERSLEIPPRIEPGSVQAKARELLRAKMEETRAEVRALTERLREARRRMDDRVEEANMRGARPRFVKTCSRR